MPIGTWKTKPNKRTTTSSQSRSPPRFSPSRHLELGDAVEDPLHALWSCSEIDIVWADQTLWDFCSSVGFVKFKQLVSWIVEEGKQLELFAFTAWPIWNQAIRSKYESLPLRFTT
ncbi:hypothetical protein SO802_016585 [Lithocarpus litseifolius]|uniref:Uncharacterized protein n=1 Tax=Lithocarpus litseifolius TaxID=425828 RepID=A0AAW2CXJ8_9ROSI